MKGTDVRGRGTSVRLWAQACRPATLLAGVVPVVVGSALAARDGHFHALPAMAALAGALLLQIGCNFANDLFDFLKGADDDSRIGPKRMTQSGDVSTRQMAWATAIAMGGAALVGVYLAVVAGWPIVWVGIAGIAAGVFYTAGPQPLGYLGLGEVLVFVFFGLAAVGGSYYVQAMTLPISAWVAGAAIGLIASAILVVNNLRDRHTDVSAGKRTLAVRFGATFSRHEYAALVLTAFTAPLYLAWEAGSPGPLLALAALPLGLHHIRGIYVTDGAALNPLLGKTAALEALFGFTLSVGVLL